MSVGNEEAGHGRCPQRFGFAGSGALEGVESVLVVEVNGDPRQVAQGSTVSTLLAELGLHPRGVAVEYNGEILKRASYEDTRLAPGDRLEIVRFVQGGRPDSLSFEDRVAIVPGGQGPLAQLVEQQTLNLRVRGSIPWRLTSGLSVRSQLSNARSVGSVSGARRGARVAPSSAPKTCERSR